METQLSTQNFEVNWGNSTRGWKWCFPPHTAAHSNKVKHSFQGTPRHGLLKYPDGKLPFIVKNLMGPMETKCHNF